MNQSKVVVGVAHLLHFQAVFIFPENCKKGNKTMYKYDNWENIRKYFIIILRILHIPFWHTLKIKNACVLKFYTPVNLRFCISWLLLLFFFLGKPLYPSLFSFLLKFLHSFNLFCILATSIMTSHLFKPFLYLFSH